MAKVRILDNQMNPKGWNVGDEVEVDYETASKWRKDGLIVILEAESEGEISKEIKPIKVEKTKKGR